MLKRAGWLGAGLTLTMLSTLASISLGVASAEAATVYLQDGRRARGLRGPANHGRCGRCPRQGRRRRCRRRCTGGGPPCRDAREPRRAGQPRRYPLSRRGQAEAAPLLSEFGERSQQQGRSSPGRSGRSNQAQSAGSTRVSLGSGPHTSKSHECSILIKRGSRDGISLCSGLVVQFMPRVTHISAPGRIG